MDLLLNVSNHLVFDKLYSSLPSPVREHVIDRDAIPRQLISLWIVLFLGGTTIYFLGAGINYHFFFDKETLNTQKIYLSVASLPWTAVVTVPWFFFELQGYSKLYDDLEHWWHVPLQVLWFLAFTDCFVYWIHRGFHHPWMYSWLHKPHHTWKDGYGQSIPYHVFVYLFPMWKPLYLFMFVFVQLWTISIHDGVYLSDDEVLLSAAHHNVHHLEFNYNYGQYTTLW
ncbi:hypothetical protein BC829DRAFT_426436 [Chytridium lagenaria]|nr:hypothetical protein BC829DRAFT_426436 [Chytridium lagenaria]